MSRELMMCKCAQGFVLWAFQRDNLPVYGNNLQKQRKNVLGEMKKLVNLIRFKNEKKNGIKAMEQLLYDEGERERAST
jgi:hypothetical protein